MGYIIFSDLDGTLLDKKYSYKKAICSIKYLKSKKLPLIFTTSKTKAEIDLYRKALRINDPFIVENGGAIYIPKGYFKFKFKYTRRDKRYFIIELGSKHKKIMNVIKKIKNKGIKILNFSNMSDEEVSKDTGLDLRKANLAKKREYNEPFKLINKKDQSGILNIIKQNKLDLVKGTKYLTLQKGCEKGRATKILIKLYKKGGKIKSVGIGDAMNDLSMFRAVNKGYLLQGFDGSYAKIKKVIKVRGIGPIGFNKVIKKLK